MRLPDAIRCSWHQLLPSHQNDIDNMMQLKIIDIEFSVCKVKDYSGIDLNQDYVFTGSTDEEKSLVCPVSLVPD